MELNWSLPTIDGGRCDGCGQCVENCPTQAVEMQGLRPFIARPRDCAYCGACEDNCPRGAIELIYTVVQKKNSSSHPTTGNL